MTTASARCAPTTTGPSTRPGPRQDSEASRAGGPLGKQWQVLSHVPKSPGRPAASRPLPPAPELGRPQLQPSRTLPWETARVTLPHTDSNSLASRKGKDGTREQDAGASACLGRKQPAREPRPLSGDLRRRQSPPRAVTDV